MWQCWCRLRQIYWCWSCFTCEMVGVVCVVRTTLTPTQPPHYAHSVVVSIKRRWHYCFILPLAVASQLSLSNVDTFVLISPDRFIKTKLTCSLQCHHKPMNCWLIWRWEGGTHIIKRTNSVESANNQQTIQLRNHWRISVWDQFGVHHVSQNDHGQARTHSVLIDASTSPPLAIIAAPFTKAWLCTPPSLVSN